LIWAYKMAIADELATSAQRFYALARVASNPVTKLQLISLGDNYLQQANELKNAHHTKRALAGNAAKTRAGAERAVGHLRVKTVPAISPTVTK
jgi:hypothetical protein